MVLVQDTLEMTSTPDPPVAAHDHWIPGKNFTLGFADEQSLDQSPTMGLAPERIGCQDNPVMLGGQQRWQDVV